MDFFTRFTREKTPQNNFSSQNFSVENNYYCSSYHSFCIAKLLTLTQLQQQQAKKMSQLKCACQYPKVKGFEDGQSCRQDPQYV